MKQFLESTDFLQTIIEQAEKNSADARQLVAGLSDEQLNWSSSPDKWSMAQCLDHLATTTKQFEPYLSSAISRGREKWLVNDAVPYKPSLVGGWLARQVMPQTKRGFPAPKAFRPAQSNITGSLERFLEQQAALLNFVRAANGVNYNKVRLRSPVTPLMRYSLADAFVVTVFHAQRHLGQARRMRETPGFPA